MAKEAYTILRVIYVKLADRAHNETRLKVKPLPTGRSCSHCPNAQNWEQKREPEHSLFTALSVDLLSLSPLEGVGFVAPSRNLLSTLPTASWSPCPHCCGSPRGAEGPTLQPTTTGLPVCHSNGEWENGVVQGWKCQAVLAGWRLQWGPGCEGRHAPSLHEQQPLQAYCKPVLL